MGVSTNRSRTPATLPLPKTTPVQDVIPTSGGFSTAPPPPLEFAPRPATVAPYVTPQRMAGSGTGASPAFASQQPPGFNPVQSFLASLPALGSTTPWVNDMTLPPEAMNPLPPAAPAVPAASAPQPGPQGVPLGLPQLLLNAVVDNRHTP